MSDLGDDFRAWREHRQKKARQNRVRADVDFDKAAAYARDHGMRLIRNAEAHYTLTNGIDLQPGHVWDDCLCAEIDPSDRPCIVCEAKGYRIEVYPGNRHIWSDPEWRPRSPFLKLPETWTLMDVVKAAAKKWGMKKETADSGSNH